MQDQQDSEVQGRTRWRRFAALMLPATAVAGAIVFGIANGAIAASFAVSGQTFKVSATRLDGTGFAQYGGVVHEKGADENDPNDPGNHPVAISAIHDARLYHLCQSVRVPNLPVVLTIHAGDGDKPARAKDLLIAMDSLKGDATFTNIQIGRDATDFDENAAKGSFGQSADRVVIKDLKQVSRATSAGTFTLTGLDLGLTFGKNAKECFAD